MIRALDYKVERRNSLSLSLSRDDKAEFRIIEKLTTEDFVIIKRCL